jgi:hypothetical protein
MTEDKDMAAFTNRLLKDTIRNMIRAEAGEVCGFATDGPYPCQRPEGHDGDCWALG